MKKKSKLSKKEMLIDIYNDPERKTILKMISEFTSLYLYHGSFPKHYLSKYLFKKDKLNIKDYYSDNFLQSVKPYLIDDGVIEIIENKLFFDLFYSQFNIITPKILMYNHRNKFVFDDNDFEVNNVMDFKFALQNLFNKYQEVDSIIIKKTYRSYGGDSIFKLYSNGLDYEDEYFSKIYDEIVKSGFLFQQTVKQHPILNELNPSSLNTIRLDTFIDKNGHINIISGFIRMSITNSYVDNGSSGGCSVGVNLQKGILKKDGYTNIHNNGAKIFTSHPLTNVYFENFKIPYFNEAKELVIKSAGLVPGLRLIGWDVGIGETGPILIEGNSRYNARGNDMISGGYRANPIFKRVLEEVEILKKNKQIDVKNSSLYN